MKRRDAIIALRDAQLKAGHLRTTRKTYRGWLCRYIDGASSGRFSDLQGFLTHLTTVDQLNPKTVKQALNAMVFFHRKVLGAEPPKNLEVPKVNKNRNQPTWLHHHEAVDLLNRMRGVPRIQAALLYGTGSRVRAMLTLRLKDIDLATGLVTFHFDKGGKSRTVRLPSTLIPALQDHIAWVKSRWSADHDSGIIAPHPEASLMRKLGRNTFASLPWYWLFPSQVTRTNRDGQVERWHATDRGLCKAIAAACRSAGITKRVTAHTFRHSHATALLQRGENPRAIQQQLGHSKLETTEIYTHVIGGASVVSPLDPPAKVIPFRTLHSEKHQAIG